MSRWAAILSTCLFAASPGLVLCAQVRSKVSCRKTHILHIGKTGGTSVGQFLKALNPKDSSRVKLEPERFFVLGSGEAEDCYAFFVRDPVERWVSGFIQHIKQYQQHGYEFDKQTQLVLRRFKTPNDLAEALESTDEVKRAEALKANNQLLQTRHGFAYYLPNLTEHMSRIAFVGETANLRHDFTALCQKIGIAAPNLSSVHSQNVCSGPLELMKAISPQAHANLRHVLHEDYKIMETLKAAGFIKSTSLQKRSCAESQKRCMVIAEDGQFRMVKSAESTDFADR